MVYFSYLQFRCDIIIMDMERDPLMNLEDWGQKNKFSIGRLCHPVDQPGEGWDASIYFMSSLPSGDDPDRCAMKCLTFKPKGKGPTKEAEGGSARCCEVFYPKKWNGAL